MESRPGRLGYGPKALYFPENFVFSPKFRLTAATTAPRAVRWQALSPFLSLSLSAPILSLQLYLHKPSRTWRTEKRRAHNTATNIESILYVGTKCVAPFFIVISLRPSGKKTRGSLLSSLRLGKKYYTYRVYTQNKRKIRAASMSVGHQKLKRTNVLLAR